MREETNGMVLGDQRFRLLLEKIPNIAVQAYGADGIVQYWNKASENLYGYSEEEAVGKSLFELIIPEEARAFVRASVEAAVFQGVDIPAGELLLIHKDGHPVAVYSSHVVIRSPGEDPQLFCIDIDMNEMKTTEGTLQQLDAEIKVRKAKEAELLVRAKQYRAATSLLTRSNDEVGDRTQAILSDALQLIGAPAGYVGIHDENSNNVIRKHNVGPIDFEHIEPQAVNTGAMAQVFANGEPVVIEDYRIYPARLEDTRLARITSIIMVPLKIGSHVKGMIAAHWLDEIHAISDEEVEILTQFAILASVVLEQIQKHEETLRLAYIDTLTGLPNRSSLAVRLAGEMKRAMQGEASGAVLFIDLDDLKVVNDNYGHSFGDSVIITAGRQIVDMLDSEDFVARIGGDEFVVVLSGGQSRKKISALADKLVRLLSRDYAVSGERIHLSASLGAAFYPEDGDNVEDLLKNADSAMYAAKNAGKDCWRFYETHIGDESYARMMLINSLRRALEQDELFLHFQPKVSCSKRRIIGFEALLRWNSPEHGSISPAKFIPLAEQSGIIVPIGQFVMIQACKFAGRLKKIGFPGLSVAVNISPRQLASDGFVDFVSHCLVDAGIDASQLELEVTETVFMESMEESIGKLLELKELGVYLALDDFGTGYSSLTYLRHLPVNTLKIDKAFIDPILADESQERFVRFIIEMAHSLNLQVVAEGVEEKLQVARLERIGCDSIQGYVYSRPLPEEEAISLLQF